MAGQWISAQRAFNFLQKVKGGNEQEAQSALFRRLKNGAIASMAARYEGNLPGLTDFDPEVSYVSDGGYYSLSTSDYELSKDFWGLVEWRGAGATVDWEFGIFAYSYFPRGRNCKQFEHATGVLLDASSLEKLVGEQEWKQFHAADVSADKPTPSKPIVNRGGRPPAPFADDLMCAIWASIYRGDLQPTLQADVEKAIKDWTVAHGHDLGDTSARDKARKIWLAMQQEVGNPDQ